MDRVQFVSVVIPTYNRVEQTIAAIESVLAQTYPHREIVVVDDGSTDSSSDEIQKFLSQKNSGSNQIRYFKQPNRGQSAARNAGIEKAQGEYIAFLDSDDVWLPEKLEWQMRAIEQFKNECGACFTDTYLVDNSGAVTTTFAIYGKHSEQPAGIELNATRLLAKSFCGYWISTLMARSDLVRQINGFDPGVSFAEDRDFYFRLSRVTSLAFVNKPLAKVYRTSTPPGSMVRPWDEAAVRLSALQYMLEKWLREDAALPPEIHRIILQDLRVAHSEWTNLYLENKRYREARQAVTKAISYDLTFGLAVKWALTWFAPAFARRLAPKATPYL